MELRVGEKLLCRLVGHDLRTARRRLPRPDEWEAWGYCGRCQARLSESVIYGPDGMRDRAGVECVDPRRQHRDDPRRAAPPNREVGPL